MKKEILLGLAVTVVAFGAACQQSAVNTNSAANQNAMNRNSMTMNQNSMPMNGNSNMSGMMDMKSSPNAANAPYDLQFLDTMSAHHQAAIDMAGSCAANAQHAEVKTLCANIISSQQKEIAEMKTWRDKWFATAAPAINMEMSGMNDSMKGMDMKSLGSLNGNDFDLAFISQMTPHHEGAVTMAKEALQKSTKPEIKTLAGAIIKAQEAEIKQMKGWQTAWAK